MFVVFADLFVTLKPVWVISMVIFNMEAYSQEFDLCICMLSALLLFFVVFCFAFLFVSNFAFYFFPLLPLFFPIIKLLFWLQTNLFLSEHLLLHHHQPKRQRRVEMFKKKKKKNYLTK